MASALVSDLEDFDLNHILQSRQVKVPQAGLQKGGWYFEDKRLTRLRDKIHDAGIPLKDYCGSPLYGIKTGLNEAFVIDSLTCERLIAQDRRSKEILRPFLEGKDIQTWHYNWRGLWLIYAYHGIDIEQYPAVLAYLKTYRPALERRATIDSHKWYELQQPQMAYSERYTGVKIIYPHFSRWPKFCLDQKGFFSNDKTYCIPGEDFYLLAVLLTFA